MIYLALQATAAVYLTAIAFLLRTTNAVEHFLLKLLPAAAGIALAFFTIADFMGWPV